jgi:hypothetical protein
VPGRRRFRGNGGDPPDREPDPTATANGSTAGATPRAPGPTITVVGLGPAGPDQLSISTRTFLATATHGYLRTRRHPAAETLTGMESFDDHYESGSSFDEVYARIVEDLVAASVVAA